MLEELGITECLMAEIRVLDISAPLLKMLVIDCSYWNDNFTAEWEYSVMLDPPRLEYLEYDDFERESYSLKSLGSLLKADIVIMRKSNGSAIHLVQGLTSVQSLCLSHKFLKALATSLDVFPMFLNLTHLTLGLNKDLGWKFLPNLLTHIPKLETLVVEVKNHGIPKTQISNMLRIAKEFFELPESERLKTYSDDPLKTTRLSTSFNVRTEKVSNWRDFLRLHCYPLQDYLHEWPTNPPSFRKDVGEYCCSARGLVLRLLEAISESLGLEEGNYIDKQIGKHGQHMAINYYPPCPQPELTYGLPAHTDANLITLLLQDDVSGLQVLRHGKWININPIPNTFIVNLGDQMQVLSNGRYKSVLHRAVVNCDKERISIPTFYCPSPDAVIGPSPELVDVDHPAAYRNYTYQEYYDKFWRSGLATQSCLDMFTTPASAPTSYSD